MGSEISIELVVSENGLVRVSDDAMLIGWIAVDEQPGFVAVSFLLPNRSVVCRMVPETAELHVALLQLQTQQLKERGVACSLSHQLKPGKLALLPSEGK